MGLAEHLATYGLTEARSVCVPRNATGVVEVHLGDAGRALWEDEQFVIDYVVERVARSAEHLAAGNLRRHRTEQRSAVFS